MSFLAIFRPPARCFCCQCLGGSTPLKINGWNIIMEVQFRSVSFLFMGDLQVPAVHLRGCRSKKYQTPQNKLKMSSKIFQPSIFRPANLPSQFQGSQGTLLFLSHLPRLPSCSRKVLLNGGLTRNILEESSADLYATCTYETIGKFCLKSDHFFFDVLVPYNGSWHIVETQLVYHIMVVGVYTIQKKHGVKQEFAIEPASSSSGGLLLWPCEFPTAHHL